MRKTTLYFIFASFLLLLSRTSFAQSTAQMGEITPVDVNFSDLARYYTTHPSPHLRKRLMNEGEKESVPKRRRADPSREAFENRAADRITSGALLPVSPSPADSFLSSVSDNTAIPPDTHGAVDSTYCVSVINDSIVIRLRTGAFVAGMGIDDFWSTLEVPGYTGAYDQRAHYDPNYGRWILVSDCYGEETGLVADSSRLFVAVSATGNPTGTWHLYTIRVGTSSGKWLDFPCVGFNSKWIAISGNFFTAAGSFSSDVIYTMNYASAMAGAALTPNTLTPGSGSFCIAPALTYDASEQNLYAAEVHNGTSGELKLWKISGAVGAPVLSAVTTYPTSTTHWQQEYPGEANFAPQLGTTDKVQTNDDRINNLQQRNGTLWCAHNVFLPATGTVTRCSAMWWEIDTTGTPVQNGLVDDPTNTIFYTFPSIAVNSENDALMGFGYLSPSVYPSAAYALHRATDPADSMRPVFVFRHGQKPYYQEFGGTENRWGDYSSTCIDPTNNRDFWTIQESVPNYTGGLANSIWDTWWAHVSLCTAVPGAATAISIPSVICSGGTATFTTPAVTGATSYTWTISGTGWSGTSTTNTVTATAGTGTATITVTPVNSCGTGAAFTVNTVTPVIAPAVTFSVANHVTTITTADMITYTGSAAPGATYTWNFGGGTGTPGTGAGPQSVVWATTGLKTVTLSVTEGGCTSAVYTDTVLVNALSGVQALNAGYISDASILPNPNNGTFDISFAQPVTTPVSVRVIDLRGHVVYSNDFAAGNSKLTVVTNNLASGTYTVSMLIDGAVSNHKITISR